MKIVAYHYAHNEAVTVQQKVVSLPFLKAAIYKQDLEYIEKEIDYQVKVLKISLMDKWYKDYVEIYIVHQSKFNCIIE
jgi:hypothetical protein